MGNTTTETRVTIVHHQGSEVVENFTFIEELSNDVDPYAEGNGSTIRVWYSDPEDDDSAYNDYYVASITEVSP